MDGRPIVLLLVVIVGAAEGVKMYNCGGEYHCVDSDYVKGTIQASTHPPLMHPNHPTGETANDPGFAWICTLPTVPLGYNGGVPAG